MCGLTGLMFGHKKKRRFADDGHRDGELETGRYVAGRTSPALCARSSTVGSVLVLDSPALCAGGCPFESVNSLTRFFNAL